MRKYAAIVSRSPVVSSYSARPSRPSGDTTTFASLPFSSSMYISPTMAPGTSVAPGSGGPSTSASNGSPSVRDGLGDEAVVDGIAANVVRDHAIDRAGVRAHVEFPLATVAPRDLDVRVDGPVAAPRRRITPDVPRVDGCGVEARRQLHRGGWREHLGRRLPLARNPLTAAATTSGVGSCTSPRRIWSRPSRRMPAIRAAVSRKNAGLASPARTRVGTSMALTSSSGSVPPVTISSITSMS